MVEHVQTASANAQPDSRIVKQVTIHLPASIQITATCIVNAMNPAQAPIAQQRIKFVQPLVVQPLALAPQRYVKAHALISRQHMWLHVIHHPLHVKPIMRMSMVQSQTAVK